jgi:hypothetical protein
MLHRVPVDVIEVIAQVALISDHVIPESIVPEAEGRCDAVSFLEVQGALALGTVKHFGEVAAFVFNPHQPVEVIGQDHVG